MDAARPIWVVADRADALRLPAAVDGAVLPLTPVARAALADAAAAQVDPRRRFTDWAQARTVVAVRRARERLLAALAALPGAGPTHREIALDHFQRAAYTGYRLWFTLGAAGPWMVPKGGGWQRCETRDAAYRALLAHMLAPVVAGQFAVARVQAPPLPGLYRRLRGGVLRAACRKRVAFVAGARKGMFGLMDAIAAEPAPARIIVVQAAGGGWGDYARLARNAWRALRGDRFLDAALLAVPQESAAQGADRLVAAVGDPVIGAAFGHFREFMAYRLAQVEPAIADARAIAAAAAPRHYLSAEVSRLSDWALAEVCGERGATRWVMSRNTHVPPASRLAEDACAGYFFSRYPEGMVDRYLFWSPHGAAAARALLPLERHGAIVSVDAVHPAKAEPARAAEGPRRILLADSFATLWFPHSWAFQTSDEFLAALGALIEAVEGMPETRLLVRAKRKQELDREDYDRLLRRSDRVSIKIRDVPFRDDLRDCHLLVAYRSTTIEEALHARRPVLLWGGSARYRYLPARVTPPTIDDRAAVYAADDEEALRRLLPAILDAHAARPLSDEEIAPHVWPSGHRAISGIARDLVSGAAGSSAASPVARDRAQDAARSASGHA